MKLYNTRTHAIESFYPLKSRSDDDPTTTRANRELPAITMYSCGPTVYDHIHIGNLSAFIVADTLRRALEGRSGKVKHLMNFTDVDDKTIRRSRERYPEIAAEEALHQLTQEYTTIFLNDMQAIGNDTDLMSFVRATDSIEYMRDLIRKLHRNGFAYITDDGVYFSIEKYKASGKTYGQLIELTSNNTSEARINNDEYDKDSVHDFALWKLKKGDEPAWEFRLGDRDLLGRPGWHIECSAMSTQNLGQPFDIHTGGVDLMFPHHENEIAQSTAGHQNSLYANFFVHNEHLLVDDKKMSKSLENFLTLRDIQERGFEPLAFRLMMLQSHYRSQSNFTWDNLQAAQNRLRSLRAFADLRWQTVNAPGYNVRQEDIEELYQQIDDDLNTPSLLAAVAPIQDKASEQLVSETSLKSFVTYLETLDGLLGLQLLQSENITDAQQALLKNRQEARDTKNWMQADNIRNKLTEQGIGVRDTAYGQIWYRL